MAEKRSWFAKILHVFDDRDTYSTDDTRLAGFRTESQIIVEEDPTEDNHVLRLKDVGVLIGPGPTNPDTVGVLENRPAGTTSYTTTPTLVSPVISSTIYMQRNTSGDYGGPVIDIDNGRTLVFKDSDNGTYPLLVRGGTSKFCGTDAPLRWHREINGPTDSAIAVGETVSYVANAKFVIVHNDGGTLKHRYIDLTGTDATWNYSTSDPG